MVLLQSFQVALRALTANKMRSSLTILGIVIGVAAVVALMAIGNGATASITSSIEGIGSNLVTVMQGRMQAGSSGQSSSSPLTFQDYEVLNAQLINTAGISPVYQKTYNVSQGKEIYSITVYAATEDYLSVNSHTLAAGRNINASDRRSQMRVAIIGSQTAKDIFGGLNPIGRSIKISGMQFEVVGVLMEKGSSGFGNADDLVLIPLETGYTKLFGSAAVQDGKQTLSAIYISADSAESVDGVITQTEFLLRRTHRLQPSEDLDFTVASQSQFLTTLSGITTTLTIFLGAIAAISLLVGGIGIMNIMLVSVTERTREIGLRKAVGARKSQILMQFLIETITLSVLGGVLGILLGLGIAWLTTALGLITAEVTISSIVMSFSFALAIGLFFGIYPAFRAARLHPMVALRYE
ncbi:MAG: multidrug ABC transporter substrate-binding protein [Chloroflexi bacterium HGW-Chloroflexi-10]|nr:MAG: multidrug ABC transporter substrate-binding protein [Chloroflexi bacterium HGW-Chloroflexi-10]